MTAFHSYASRSGSPSPYRKRCFQEVDIVGITRCITKYGVTVRRRERHSDALSKSILHRPHRSSGIRSLLTFQKMSWLNLAVQNITKNVNIRGYKPTTERPHRSAQTSPETFAQSETTIIPCRRWSSNLPVLTKSSANVQ